MITRKLGDLEGIICAKRKASDGTGWLKQRRCLRMFYVRLEVYVGEGKSRPGLTSTNRRGEAVRQLAKKQSRLCSSTGCWSTLKVHENLT